MKFAAINFNGHYRATLAYDKIIVTKNDFTRGGQRIELYTRSKLVVVVYGRVSPLDPDEKVSNLNDLDEVIIEIAE